ncbi:hypothetical protein E2C01_094061 [Portunus trituberculatus]|uniref:Transmembrane protein n=1 Tax=Portunus trituberculatus TaxID=210409 RepID=A0A5B7JKR0_PORTR|nr:hypothetical protein [Portunus trituberculatus]
MRSDSSQATFYYRISHSASKWVKRSAAVCLSFMFPCDLSDVFPFLAVSAGGRKREILILKNKRCGKWESGVKISEVAVVMVVAVVVVVVVMVLMVVVMVGDTLHLVIN